MEPQWELGLPTHHNHSMTTSRVVRAPPLAGCCRYQLHWAVFPGVTHEWGPFVGNACGTQWISI